MRASKGSRVGGSWGSGAAANKVREEMVLPRGHRFCTSISECSVARGSPWDKLPDSASKHLEAGHHTHSTCTDWGRGQRQNSTHLKIKTSRCKASPRNHHLCPRAIARPSRHILKSPSPLFSSDLVCRSVASTALRACTCGHAQPPAKC